MYEILTVIRAAKSVVVDREEKSETVPARQEPLRKKKTFLLVSALVALQSILRLVFFYVGTYSGAQLITPAPPAVVMDFINVFSVVLGVAGLVFIPELVFQRRWGLLGDTSCKYSNDRI
jgi:hypothetical protein